MESSATVAPRRRSTHLLAVLATNVAVFCAVWLLLETGCQLVARAWPSYDVLFLQADRALGWKQVPNLRWTWAGHHWYAADFRVDIETNAQGFRDRPRDTHKPASMRRVALLGDSFVEAVQVPFDRTAGQLAERRLNRGGSMWEVLNFGISNYGVGQYLLAWEQHARHYQPDVVAIFVAGFHLTRTVTKYETGAFESRQRLWIRPTFRLDGDALIREPARDYQALEQIQADVMRTGFHGQRSRPKRNGLITLSYLSALKGVSSQETGGSPEQVVAVNRAVIEELGRQVRGAGAQLVILDASQYFGDPGTVSQFLRDVSVAHGFGYVPLGEALREANRSGVVTRWDYDAHFNEAGHEVMAKALVEFLARAPARSSDARIAARTRG